MENFHILAERITQELPMLKAAAVVNMDGIVVGSYNYHSSIVALPWERINAEFKGNIREMFIKGKEGYVFIQRLNSHYALIVIADVADSHALGYIQSTLKQYVA